MFTKQLIAPSRPDLATAEIVEAGIAYLATHGDSYAAAYLDENNVSFNVMVRVLTEPEHRRSSHYPDW
ncbi:MAG: hypothetical protein Q7R66_21725 [Undibacterium sp.]|uniref:hypothetical protein n=1 Tax=Undibacterium sp. TaxID=1914977 RepID=UPI00272481A1|nr:hypothetical protein [Undibacterium sp.]MDO8654797.1 hypothetical protein [Undibacterium sp.]